MAKVHTENFIIIQVDWKAVAGDSHDNWSIVVGRFALC